MFTDYTVKNNQLVITIDLNEEEFLNLKKSSSGKTYLVLSERLNFDFKGYPIKGNLNLYVSSKDYEEIMDTKKLAAMGKVKSNKSNSKSNANDIEARIDNLENILNQLVVALKK